MELTTQYVEKMGSDSQRVFGGTFEGGYHLQQIPDEITPCINDIIDSKVKIENFLEIGSAAGGSTYLFNHVFNLENTVIIDDNKHPKHIYRSSVIKKIKCNILEFIGSSHEEAAIEFVEKLKLKFDIILIDGGHSFSDAYLDAENYSPFLNNNGFLLFHDIEVFDYIDAVFKRFGKSGDYKMIKKYISKTHSTPCGIGLLQRS